MTLVTERARKNSSGQLLIVAALAIAILISSTTAYVYELSRKTNGTDAKPVSTFVLAVKQATGNAMIGSLVNISNAQGNAVLAANLNEFSQVLRDMNYFGICNLTFALLNDLRYDSGIWLSWNASGKGVSSAFSDFTFSIHDMACNVTVDYAVNITTTVTISGYYTELSGNEKLVNLTCRVCNEGEPALAKNMSIFYEKQGSWTLANSSNNLSIMDYGNGTYRASFIVDIASDNVPVSVHAYDSREIFVRANVTCYKS